jgi:Ca2+-binding RTX toxin-like protein
MNDGNDTLNMGENDDKIIMGYGNDKIVFNGRSGETDTIAFNDDETTFIQYNGSTGDLIIQLGQ